MVKGQQTIQRLAKVAEVCGTTVWLTFIDYCLLLNLELSRYFGISVLAAVIILSCAFQTTQIRIA